ncbi:hypothetical protein GGTG_12457 [Gaeumannomyces tritici R3-111a-1]|uniref:Uncharacterized protein n=1 Tax=Gaeumannomyces tritici (strain R3-111a-1) TaxID=644352 RepID=J3PG31_GAET3|nr:hypothetical protein GGTG_12457 [Gaeumannomyces tritici R3-111a-1]EJT70284.1 hypothetical protein GGTG_12457 [Gaeumannomyces tritici R3-111a-1]
MDFAALKTKLDETTIWSVRGNSTRDAAGVLKAFLWEAFKRLKEFYEANKIDTSSGIAASPWGTAAIDFQFSVPSLVDKEGREKLVKIAREALCQAAGHGDKSPRKHTIHDIALTEAEAVGACAINMLSPFDKDLAMLAAVDQNKSGSKSKDGAETHVGIKANFMVPIMSKEVGGSHLDKDFIERLVRYLEPLALPWCEGITPQHAAQEVCQSAEYFKVKAGYSSNTAGGEYSGTLLTGLESGASVSVARQDGMSIVDNTLSVDGAVFEQLFEQQLAGSGPGKYAAKSILAQVLNMRDDLWAQNPSQSDLWKALMGRQGAAVGAVDTIDFVVFAGGMGASKYVQQRVKQGLRLEIDETRKLEVGAKRPDLGEVTRHTEFVSYPQPQLCVAAGLALARKIELMPESGRLLEGIISVTQNGGREGGAETPRIEVRTETSAATTWVMAAQVVIVAAGAPNKLPTPHRNVIGTGGVLDKAGAERPTPRLGRQTPARATRPWPAMGSSGRGDPARSRRATARRMLTCRHCTLYLENQPPGTAMARIEARVASGSYDDDFPASAAGGLPGAIRRPGATVRQPVGGVSLGVTGLGVFGRQRRPRAARRPHKRDRVRCKGEDGRHYRTAGSAAVGDALRVAPSALSCKLRCWSPCPKLSWWWANLGASEPGPLFWALIGSQPRSWSISSSGWRGAPARSIVPAGGHLGSAATLAKTTSSPACSQLIVRPLHPPARLRYRHAQDATQTLPRHIRFRARAAFQPHLICVRANHQCRCSQAAQSGAPGQPSSRHSSAAPPEPHLDLNSGPDSPQPPCTRHITAMSPGPPTLSSARRLPGGLAGTKPTGAQAPRSCPSLLPSRAARTAQLPRCIPSQRCFCLSLVGSFSDACGARPRPPMFLARPSTARRQPPHADKRAHAPCHGCHSTTTGQAAPIGDRGDLPFWNAALSPCALPLPPHTSAFWARSGVACVGRMGALGLPRRVLPPSWASCHVVFTLFFVASTSCGRV